MKRELVARELVLIAEELADDEIEDPKFVEKIRNLKTILQKLTNKKRRQLRQLGVNDPIRPSATVEELVDLLISIANS